jgi:hypothetical protein
MPDLEYPVIQSKNPSAPILYPQYFCLYPWQRFVVLPSFVVNSPRRQGAFGGGSQLYAVPAKFRLYCFASGPARRGGAALRRELRFGETELLSYQPTTINVTTD